MSIAEIAASPGFLIQRSLRGEVIDVLRVHLPSISNAGQEMYDAVMNDPALLHDCFMLFRKRPELFARVVVDPQGKPVTEDTGMLACGRSLAEAIAMIIQGGARRYFRATLGGKQRIPVKPLPRPWWKVLMELARLAKPPPPRFKVLPGRGERLFEAIRQYLCYEWQTALIPHYAPLSPETVTRLGAQLLDIREPSELQALAADETAAKGTMPLILDTTNRLLQANGDTIDAELLWTVFAQMDLARLFPEQDAQAHRRAIALVAGTSRRAIKSFNVALKGNLRQFVTFLFVAYTELGEDVYREILAGSDSKPAIIQRIAERLAKIDPMPPPVLDEMRTTFTAILR